MRAGTTFLKCPICGSIYQDISPSEFDSLHIDAFADKAFVSGIVGALGAAPNRRMWEELSPFLPGSSLLEIGPGSGHFLAAARDAGRAVTAVESSSVHRDFIRQTWGISEVYDSFSSLPPSVQFDAIISINTLEHVYSIDSFLAEVRERMSPAGVFLLSTVNSGAILTRLIGTYWPQFKPSDHVSFPSASGLTAASRRANLVMERIWSSELPLETVISVLLAGRDLLRERRAAAANASSSPDGVGDDAHSADATLGTGSVALRRVFAGARRIDPTSSVLGKLGRAATIKATMTKA